MKALLLPRKRETRAPTNLQPCYAAWNSRTLYPTTPVKSQSVEGVVCVHLRQVVENTPNLFIREAMVTDVILGKNDNIEGVRIKTYPALNRTVLNTKVLSAKVLNSKSRAKKIGYMNELEGCGRTRVFLK